MKNFKQAFLASILCILPGGVTIAQEETVAIPSDTPNEIRTAFNDGVHALNDKDFATAISKLGEVEKVLPDCGPLHRYLGYALSQSGKTAEAVAEYEQSLRIKDDDEETLYLLGALYQITGQRDKAIQEWERYLLVNHTARHTDYVKNAVKMLSNENNRRNIFADSKGRDDYLDETTAQYAMRWPAKKMPLPVYIKDADGIPGYKASFDTTLRESFAEWEKWSQGKVSFRPVDSPEQAVIDVDWTSNKSDLGNATEAGETKIAGIQGSLVHCHIVLLTKSFNGGPVQDIKGTCLHEIGHAIGLIGHSSNNDDIMFMMAKNEDSSKVALSDRDKKTLVALYSLTPAQMAEYNHELSPTTPVVITGSNNIYQIAKKFFEVGNAAFNAGKFDVAAKFWEQAAKMQPDTIAYKVDLGLAYLNLGQKELSAKDFANAQKHLELSAKNYTAGKIPDKAIICYDMLAKLAREQKDGVAAQKYQSESIKLKQSKK